PRHRDPDPVVLAQSSAAAQKKFAPGREPFNARGVDGAMHSSPSHHVGLKVFLLYCALLATAGPAMFWSARLGWHIPSSRVEGFVGYFWDDSGKHLSHVAIPLEGDRNLFLDGAEVSDVISAGMRIEKRRAEFAMRFDDEPAAWPLQTPHLVLALGGLLALGLLGWSVARAP